MTTPMDRLVGQLSAACNLADRLARHSVTSHEVAELDRVSAELAKLANAVMRLGLEDLP